MPFAFVRVTRQVCIGNHLMRLAQVIADIGISKIALAIDCPAFPLQIGNQHGSGAWSPDHSDWIIACWFIIARFAGRGYHCSEYQ